MHIFGGGKNTLPSCFSDLFKWEKPEDSHVLLEKFLVENQIQVVINQRFQDTSLITNLRRATAPHGIRLYSVFHNMPGFEFRTAHTGLKRVIRLLYNVKLKRKWGSHYNELVSNSDKVILLAKDYVSQFSKSYHIPMCNSSKLAVIPNPCTLEGGIGARKEQKILVVSRLSESQKRIFYILKAWMRISKSFPDWSLEIVGDGQSRSQYEDFCQKNAIQQVTFYGRQHPVPFYQKAAVFLMTSNYEGWPLTNIEAMSYGVVPVVMDSFASIHEIIDDGVNGFITPNNNLQVFQEKVILLLKDTELRNRMSLAAYEKSKMFAIDSVAEMWRKLFNE